MKKQAPEEIFTSLCWKCRRSGKSCSWMRSFIPVAGWKAVRYDYKCYISGNRLVIKDSYIVAECPLFLREKRVKGREEDDF